MARKMQLVDLTARLLGYRIGMDKMVRIADRFSLVELERIYLRVVNTGRRIRICRCG